jgi:hypothetical protein
LRHIVHADRSHAERRIKIHLARADAAQDQTLVFVANA